MYHHRQSNPNHHHTFIIKRFVILYLLSGSGRPPTFQELESFLRKQLFLRKGLFHIDVFQVVGAIVPPHRSTKHYADGAQLYVVEDLKPFAYLQPQVQGRGGVDGDGKGREEMVLNVKLGIGVGKISILHIILHYVFI